MARTSKSVSARERARAARLRVDQDRAERDRKIEDAAARFFVAADKRAAIVAQLDALDADAGEAVRDLLDLGESQARTAALLDIDAREVRRLRALSLASTAATAPADGALGVRSEDVDDAVPAGPRDGALA